MENRRRSTRFDAKLIAYCRKASQNDSCQQHFVLSTKDLSDNGARIIAPCEVRAGEEVTLSLDIPAFFLPVVIKARVVWTKTESFSDDKLIEATVAGVKFLKVDRFDYEKILNFLARQNELCAKADMDKKHEQENFVDIVKR